MTISKQLLLTAYGYLLPQEQARVETHSHGVEAIQMKVVDAARLAEQIKAVNAAKLANQVRRHAERIKIVAGECREEPGNPNTDDKVDDLMEAMRVNLLHETSYESGTKLEHPMQWMVPFLTAARDREDIGTFRQLLLTTHIPVVEEPVANATITSSVRVKSSEDQKGKPQREAIANPKTRMAFVPSGGAVTDSNPKECPFCTTQNPTGASECIACETDFNDVTAQKAAFEKFEANFAGMEDWTECPMCGLRNPSTAEHCYACRRKLQIRSSYNLVVTAANVAVEEEQKELLREVYQNQLNRIVENLPTSAKANAATQLPKANLKVHPKVVVEKLVDVRKGDNKASSVDIASTERPQGSRNNRNQGKGITKR